MDVLNTFEQIYIYYRQWKKNKISSDDKIKWIDLCPYNMKETEKIDGWIQQIHKKIRSIFEKRPEIETLKIQCIFHKNEKYGIHCGIQDRQEIPWILHMYETRDIMEKELLLQSKYFLLKSFHDEEEIEYGLTPYIGPVLRKKGMDGSRVDMNFEMLKIFIQWLKGIHEKHYVHGCICLEHLCYNSFMKELQVFDYEYARYIGQYDGIKSSMDMYECIHIYQNELYSSPYSTLCKYVRRCDICNVVNQSMTFPYRKMDDWISLCYVFLDHYMHLPWKEQWKQLYSTIRLHIQKIWKDSTHMIYRYFDYETCKDEIEFYEALVKIYGLEMCIKDVSLPSWLKTFYKTIEHEISSSTLLKRLLIHEELIQQHPLSQKTYFHALLQYDMHVSSHYTISNDLFS